MQDRYQKLADLLNLAIDEADLLLKTSDSDEKLHRIKPELQLTITNLTRLRDAALTRKIPCQSNGATLGLSRNIGEFIHEGRLRTLADQIDETFAKGFVE